MSDFDPDGKERRRGARPGTGALISAKEALEIVLAEAAALGSEVVSLDQAFGRVLAQVVLAPADMPSVDRSAMDGYALRSADLASEVKKPAGDLPSVGRELQVVGFIPAGASNEGIEIRPGQAARIMTGAPVPSGADAVQMVERAEEVDGGARVRIFSAVRPGENIFRRGADLERGAIVLPEGVPIRAAEMGALAAVGETRPRVYRRPVARLLCTGDEIIEPAAEPLPHQIRNSNGPALHAALTSAGLDRITLGVARDDPDDLDRKIEAGLSGDLFLLVGGVSVGDRDLVAERLRLAAVRVLFHRIAVKPGKPLLFGRRDRCLVFGLPGNPLSALTDFLVFVLPAIQKMSGLSGRGLPEVRAVLADAIKQKPGRIWYRLARVDLVDGRFEATPVPSTGSGDLVSATRANGFIIVPADAEQIGAGTEVRALLWPGFV